MTLYLDIESVPIEVPEGNHKAVLPKKAKSAIYILAWPSWGKKKMKAAALAA